MTPQSFARVVELVDTQVSEACALTAWGFESPLGHHPSPAAVKTKDAPFHRFGGDGRLVPG